MSIAMRWSVLFLLAISELAAQRPRLTRKPVDDFDAKQISISGVVKSFEPTSLVIEAGDQRFLTFKIVKSTKMPSSAPVEGDYVKVSGTQDDEAYLTATEVSLDKNPKAADTSETASVKPPGAPVILKKAKPDPDDNGPPRLRHGQPNPVPAPPLPADEPDTGVARAVPDSVLKGTTDRAEATEGERPKPLSPTADLIDRAREWALSFTETLPNYVCQQFTTRYLKIPGQRDWQAKDVVSANVVYENGKEDYRNIAINGKAQSKKMEELPGSWSTGEFGTTLRSLFHPGRRAIFKYVKQTQIIGMTASVYDYSVKREYSDWRVQLGSQAIVPAYSGRVWIDQKTARVIRIEMQADEIPKDFPLDRVESANDYGLVRLATADQFMLPLHAETLSCERGSTFCSRNAIEFRNYRKFSGEANITFQ